jgi:hypothetical protein
VICDVRGVVALGDASELERARADYGQLLDGKRATDTGDGNEEAEDLVGGCARPEDERERHGRAGQHDVEVLDEEESVGHNGVGVIACE